MKINIKENKIEYALLVLGIIVAILTISAIFYRMTGGNGISEDKQLKELSVEDSLIIKNAKLRDQYKIDNGYIKTYELGAYWIYVLYDSSGNLISIGS